MGSREQRGSQGSVIDSRKEDIALSTFQNLSHNRRCALLRAGMQSRSHDGLLELTADSFRYLTLVFAAVDRLIPNVVRIIPICVEALLSEC